MPAALRPRRKSSPASGERPVVEVRPRLLLVEDDATLCAVLVRLLGKKFDVVALSDGATAAERMITDRFDILLSDIHVRGMSGIELLRAVRTHDADIPVILMTGLPDVDGAIEAMDLGALSYIKKPFDPALLETALDRATRVAHARSKRETVITAPIGAMSSSSSASSAPSASPSSSRITTGTNGAAEHALTASFERALDSMWIAFQPIVDGRSRETIGFEALVRSNEPTMPTPSTMLEAAERLGRIHDLGRCVRERTAISFENEPGNALLFINLHSADLLDDDLFSETAPLSRIADRVVLEITERASIGDLTDARRRAGELRTRGFKIAIDDLGAGYAGLTSFATFEPEIVKLDMSLVRGVESSNVKRLIVGRIAALCHDLQMRVVAEGIETTDELACMLDLGCEYLQGYLLGRPDGTRRPSGYSW